MICTFAGCTDTATVRCRMGNGLVEMPGHRVRQTFVRYCDPHFQIVNDLFVLCDIAFEDRPNGPSTPRLPGRHPELVARLSP